VVIPGITREPISFGVLNIQARATERKIRSVHFSPDLSGPRSLSSCPIISLLPDITFGICRWVTDVSQNQAINRNMTIKGTAKIIHEKKSISGAAGKILDNWATRIPFGGVPIRVAIPPMVAAYATPRRRQVANCRSPPFSLFLSVKTPGRRVVTRARAIGIIIIAVAVLEIHIEINAVATMNPSTSFFVPEPARLITLRAMRR